MNQNISNQTSKLSESHQQNNTHNKEEMKRIPLENFNIKDYIPENFNEITADEIINVFKILERKGLITAQEQQRAINLTTRKYNKK